jgi:hypothetical protein
MQDMKAAFNEDTQLLEKIKLKSWKWKAQYSKFKNSFESLVSRKEQVESRGLGIKVKVEELDQPDKYRMLNKYEWNKISGTPSKDQMRRIQDGNYGTEADSLSSDSKTLLRHWSHTLCK